MKKVIGAVLASTLVAGVAFADPAITLNFRQRAYLYDQTQTYIGGGTDDTNKVTKMWDFTGYGGDTDCFVVDISTDYAGAHLDTDYGTGTVGATETTASLDAYYGWVKFGGLTITGGKSDTRYTDKLTNGATQINLTDQESAKLGVSKFAYNKTYFATGYKAIIGIDSDNFTAINGTKATSLVAAYAVKDLPGTLTLKAGIVDNNYKTDESTADDKKYQYAGYAFSAAYLQPGLVDLEAIVKMPEQDQTVFGVFGTLLAVKNLKAVVGFTYANDSIDGPDWTSATSADRAKHTEMAFDVRAQYQINDKTKTVAHFNYSSVKPDGDDAETSMYIIGDASYIVSDLVTGELSAGYYANDLDDNDKADLGENYFVIEPAVQFTAGKNAILSTGFRYQAAMNTGDAKNSTYLKNRMSIPMVFRVKM